MPIELEKQLTVGQSASVITEVGDVTVGFHIKFHVWRHDKELALAVAFPVAAGQFGLERASHDMHVLLAVGTEVKFAGFNDADGSRAIERVHGEALDFAVKIGIVFHASRLMRLFDIVCKRIIGWNPLSGAVGCDISVELPFTGYLLQRHLFISHPARPEMQNGLVARDRFVADDLKVRYHARYLNEHRG